MLNKFLSSLQRNRTDSVFNPWYDFDYEHDIDIYSPRRRLKNLTKYLEERKHAKHLIVGEALGYQGGHFSGIPMTSERILLGNMAHHGIKANFVTKTFLDRTSRPSVRKLGFSEPTATIVWRCLIENNFDTFDFVFWNAFPWHPFNEEKGILSNRAPKKSEIMEGKAVIEKLLELFGFKKIFAMGSTSFNLLQNIDSKIIHVRHPAYGGSNKFKQELLENL